MTRLIETSLADYYETMFPEEDSPTVLLGKLLSHLPKGSSKWDSEDAALFARDMPCWLSKSHFDLATHPRLCGIGALAEMYDFTIELIAVRPAPDGQGNVNLERCGAAMRSRLTLKQTMPWEVKPK